MGCLIEQTCGILPDTQSMCGSLAGKHGLNFRPDIKCDGWPPASLCPEYLTPGLQTVAGSAHSQLNNLRFNLATTRANGQVSHGLHGVEVRYAGENADRSVRATRARTRTRVSALHGYWPITPRRTPFSLPASNHATFWPNQVLVPESLYFLAAAAKSRVASR